MKVKFIVLIACLITKSVEGTALQFAQMVNFKSALPPTKYLGYGNYCGLGGKGETLDIIDRCCRQHDRCISIANKRSCLPFSFLQYFALPYTWFMSKGRIYCSKSNSSCSGAYCNCDRQCAECFAKYDRFYNRKLKRGILRK